LVLDIVIAVIFVAAVVVGFQRGLLQPLLAEAAFLAALVIILRNRQGFAALIERLLHTDTPVLPVVIAVIIAIIAGFLGGQVGIRLHRMPVVRGVDGFLGVFLHALTAVIFLYLVVSALVVANLAFTPLLNAAKLTLAQVDTLRATLEMNPLTGALGDSHSMRDLQAEARSPNGATLSSAPQLKAAELFFDDFLQPQLRSSRLDVWVLRIGVRIPVIGHIGPADLAHVTAKK
jgi:uncharacterized membrane protein required for colicin V production